MQLSYGGSRALDVNVVRTRGPRFSKNVIYFASGITRHCDPSRNIDIGGTGDFSGLVSVGRHLFRKHRYLKKVCWVR